MNSRRLFIFIVLAFSFVGCQREDAVDTGSWTQDVTREVDLMLNTIDGWMEDVDADTRSEMTRVFLEALLYEYAFWDYGYSGPEKDYSYVTRLEEWL